MISVDKNVKEGFK